jgi:hypothetical protein
MVKSWTILTMCLLSSLYAFSQFQSPVKHAIRLGGTFGELRGTHFHAGIDIKPSSQGYEGDTIYAIGDGFVSRMKTQRGGFGRVVYIDHPSGHRSVYAHLSKILEPLAAALLSYQKSSESYEVDLNLGAEKLKIKKGQAIGILGNAGSSFGAHLHFEIREPTTDITLNPFDFGIKPKDIQSPAINIIGIHGLTPDLYDVSYIPFAGFAKARVASIPTLSIPAWRAGISINASDMQDGAPNKNGYYEAKLFVDDTLYYHFKMDKVSYDEGSLINCFIDYSLRKKQKRTEALLYKMPTNTSLPVKQVVNDGLISLYSQIERRIRLEVFDHHGNKSNAFFNLKRAEEVASLAQRPDNLKYLTTLNAHDISGDIAKVSFEAGSFARNQYLDIKKSLGPLRCVSVGDKNEATIKDFELCMLIEEGLNVTNKTTIVSDVEDGKPSGFGGRRIGNSFCTKVSSLGSYCLVDDLSPPSVSILTNLKNLKTAKSIIARLEDNINYKSPAKSFSYKVYIDGVFKPCEYKESTKRLTIPLSGLEKGAHILKIVVIDFVNNENVLEQEFVF